MTIVIFQGSIRILAVAFFLVAASPVGGQQTPAAGLTNGSLEQEVDGKPAGWRFGGSDQFEWSMDAEHALVGESCVRMDSTAAENLAPNTFGNLMQTIDATPFRGQIVRFRAAVKTARRTGDGRAQLWLRVDRKASGGRPQMGAFDNMGDRPITGDEWDYYEITAEIAEDAESLVAGMLVFGNCQAWLDDASLEVLDDATGETTAAKNQAVTTSAFVDDPPQPFFNHWLWLVLIALSLFVISQVGRFGGVVNLRGEALRSSWIGRFALRFSVVYWLLYSLPAPFTSLLFDWGNQLQIWYRVRVDQVVRWTAAEVLGIGKTLVPPGGSGDTTFDFVRLLICFVVAMAVALLWSLVDRRKTGDRILNDLLRSYLRYVLAFTLLGYGLAKTGWMFNQFPEPGMNQLTKTWGDSSPMNVVWAFMGASRAYTLFAGLGEVVAAVLLIWRRTTTLGAMIAFGVMLNVVMLNFCYDVPVKQYSSHLLCMALFLVLPDARRLANILLWNRPTLTVKTRPPYTGPRTIWIHRAIKAWIIVVGMALPIYNKVVAEINYDPDALDAPAFYGWYEVEEFRRGGERIPPLTTDSSRWRSVNLQRYPWGGTGGESTSDVLAVTLMDGGFRGGRCTWSADTRSIRCPGVGPGELRVRVIDDEHIEIASGQGDPEMRVRLRRKRREDFLLVNRGFRWINERPYNR